MKNFRFTHLLVLLVLVTSCEKEELPQKEIDIAIDNPAPAQDILPKDKDVDFSLRFTIKTEEDQMGKFAQNAMTTFRGKVWSVGGSNDYGASGFHFIWNSDNGINWATTPIATTTPSAFHRFRVGHTLTVFKDQLWLIGGRDETDTEHTYSWFSADGMDWSEMVTPFGPVSDHTVLVYNDRMFVILGNAASGQTEVWATTNGTDWTLETDRAFSGRAGQKGVVFNDTMYLIGGEDTSGTKLAEIWASTNGRDWNRMDPPFSGRNAHTATVYNGKVWVIGGQDAGTLFSNEIWYSSDMHDWEQYGGTRPGSDGISSHSVLQYEDALWLFGGLQDDGAGDMEARGEVTTIEEE